MTDEILWILQRWAARRRRKVLGISAATAAEVRRIKAWGGPPYRQEWSELCRYWIEDGVLTTAQIEAAEKGEV